MSLGKRLLIIDDEEADLELSRAEFERRGYDVTAVLCNDSADSAFVSQADFRILLRQVEPDAILTDFKMGLNWNGVNIQRVAKSYDPKLPIFIHTKGLDEVTDRTQRNASRDGFVAVALKGEYDKIDAAITEYFNRSKNPGSAIT